MSNADLTVMKESWCKRLVYSAQIMVKCYLLCMNLCDKHVQTDSILYIF